MSDKTVSVVIACYNHARFIKQAIESVVNQSYPDLELIIVDDASTDGSKDIILQAAKDYNSRFTKIIIEFNEENEGAHNAFNKGAAKAHSNYISLLNSDDLYQENRITSMMNSLKSNSRVDEIAFSAVKCVDESGGELNTSQAARFESIQNRLAKAPFKLLASLAENVAVSTGNLLFTKDLFNKLGGFKNYKYIHDYDFFLRSCLITEPVYDKDTFYLYRLHGDNTFSKIHRTGVIENRILWLDAYNQIKRGSISNQYILSFDNYISLIEEQIKREGDKKRVLWRISGNPAIKFAVSLIKKIRRIR